MKLFRNKIQKRQTKNHIENEKSNLTYSLNCANTNFSAVKVMVNNLQKCENITDEGNVYLQRKYTEKIIENLQKFVFNITESIKVFNSLKKYADEFSEFVSSTHKKEIEKFSTIFKTFELNFINLYSYSLVTVQIQEHHKTAIRNEFVNTIKNLGYSIHTDEKVESSNDEETHTIDNKTTEEV